VVIVLKALVFCLYFIYLLPYFRAVKAPGPFARVGIMPGCSSDGGSANAARAFDRCQPVPSVQQRVIIFYVIRKISQPFGFEQPKE
jgi:hypothetical protein